MARHRSSINNEGFKTGTMETPGRPGLKVYLLVSASQDPARVGMKVWDVVERGFGYDYNWA